MRYPRVDGHPQRSEFSGRGESRPHLGGVRDIGRYEMCGLAEVFGDPTARSGGQVHNHDGGSLPRQPLDDGTPEAGSAAGDDGYGIAILHGSSPHLKARRVGVRGGGQRVGPAS